MPLPVARPARGVTSRRGPFFNSHRAGEIMHGKNTCKNAKDAVDRHPGDQASAMVQRVRGDVAVSATSIASDRRRTQRADESEHQ